MWFARFQILIGEPQSIWTLRLCFTIKTIKVDVINIIFQKLPVKVFVELQMLFAWQIQRYCTEPEASFEVSYDIGPA